MPNPQPARRPGVIRRSTGALFRGVTYPIRHPIKTVAAPFRAIGMGYRGTKRGYLRTREGIRNMGQSPTWGKIKKGAPWMVAGAAITNPAVAAIMAKRAVRYVTRSRFLAGGIIGYIFGRRRKPA